MHRAADMGVAWLGLTDHDTTEGIAEAREASADAGVELVAGVEISVTWNGQTVHIVGLGVDVSHAELQAGLKSLRDYRDWRAEEIGRRLAKKGIEGAFEGAKAFSNGRLISRTHFARFLVQRNLAKDERDVFKHYLVKGKPGHVSGDWAELEQAVNWINNAGGQAVVAHPARYRMTRSKLRRLIGQFAETGGAGLEVVSSSHSKDESFNMARHARDFKLLSSLGSDFHNPDMPWVELGRLPALPEGCIPVWRDWPLPKTIINDRSVA